MKERMIALAKTYPSISKKYESLVCVGGIKEDGTFRRIYPVEWREFWGHKGFKKKDLIEYELREDIPSDHRVESRKVNIRTIQSLGEMPFSKINDMLKSKVTTLEELREISHTKVSMGVIIPEILDFIWRPNPNFEKNINRSKQQDLDGNSVVKTEILPWTFAYVFKCSPKCPKPHTQMCEDWEVYELYRNCEEYLKEGKYKDEDEVLIKVKQRFLNDMKAKKLLYFLVGTHFLQPTYLIISVIYPKKKDTF